MQLKDVFQWKQVSGKPLKVNDLTITPQSQALIIRLPRGGFVWHRPTFLLVEQDGQVKHLPIVDVSRMLQLGLFAAGAVITIAGLLAFKQRKEHIS
jgi:hypothetical protein